MRQLERRVDRLEERAGSADQQFAFDVRFVDTDMSESSRLVFADGVETWYRPDGAGGWVEGAPDAA